MTRFTVSRRGQNSIARPFAPVSELNLHGSWTMELSLCNGMINLEVNGRTVLRDKARLLTLIESK
jgi:hypothetical protein